MTIKATICTIIAALLLFISPTQAEQLQGIKDVEVHYSAFNSTFLTPKIARTYDLQRNEYVALLNITVLDNSQLGKPAVEAKISGQVTNLIGQIQPLEFRLIKEADAVYYISAFDIDDQDTLRFEISIDAGLKGRGILKFHQQFYSEE